MYGGDSEIAQSLDHARVGTSHFSNYSWFHIVVLIEDSLTAGARAVISFIATVVSEYATPGGAFA
jgi:hypothetical protein